MSEALRVGEPAARRRLTGGDRRRARERAIELALALSAALCVLAVVGIFAVLLLNAADAFLIGGAITADSLTPDERALLTDKEFADLQRMDATRPTLLAFLTGAAWNPTGAPPFWGVLAMVVSTGIVTVLSMAIAVPVGVGVAAWLAFVAPARARELLKPTIELLAAIPSVVIGFIGIVFTGPLIARVFGLGNGLNAMNGAVLLAIMALPTIISLSEDAIRAVPRDYVQASLALGADRWQSLVRVVLPAASSGLVAATMLGMGRAIGETMTVLMATGNAVAMPHGVFDSVRTLTATIAIELGEVPQGSTHYHMLFGVGLVLFVITFAVNLLSEIYVRKRAVRPS